MTTKLFALLLAFLLVGCAPKEDTKPIQDSPAPSVSASAPPSSDAPPTGVKRTVHYNNCRYSLLSSEQPSLPETLSLGEPLETLPDGTILYAHPDYHPEFRLIVQSGDQMQLAELSGFLGEENRKRGSQRSSGKHSAQPSQIPFSGCPLLFGFFPV